MAINELDMPLMLFASRRMYLSVAMPKTMMDENMKAVERRRVFFLPILSEIAPPGKRNTAVKMRFEEIKNPKKVVE